MRRRFRGQIRLKHLSQTGLFPSGNERWYYRPKGQKGVKMPDAPKDSPEFLKAYVAASGDAPAPKIKHKSYGEGTIGAGVIRYLQSSSFLGLAQNTRPRWRSACEDIKATYGHAKMDDLEPRHIKRDLAEYDSHPSNNRLKVWRSLTKFWDQVGDTETHVALQVKPKDTPKTDGFTPWTREDFDLFRKHWAIGTKERFAMELMYRTCAAISDMCDLARPMVDADGWITYVRQKSKGVATSPFYAVGPDWFEATDDLAACLALEPKHITFFTTQHNKPRSHKSASQWFSAACRAAGLERGKTAHGIRKGRAAMFKENGTTSDQRMAILGHETEAEARRYSASADLRRTVEGTKKFQLSAQVPTQQPKSLKGQA